MRIENDGFSRISKEHLAYSIYSNVLFEYSGAPNLQDLMPHDLRWSWCDHNRNKVYNKCNALESSWNHRHPPPPRTVVCGKIVFHETCPWCQKVCGPFNIYNLTYFQVKKYSWIIDLFYFFIFIKIWLTNKNCVSIGCTTWFVRALEWLI